MIEFAEIDLLMKDVNVCFLVDFELLADDKA
jgi:hypothetical protein